MSITVWIVNLPDMSARMVAMYSIFQPCTGTGIIIKLDVKKSKSDPEDIQYEDNLGWPAACPKGIQGPVIMVVFPG